MWCTSTVMPTTRHQSFFCFAQTEPGKYLILHNRLNNAYASVAAS